jgi:hypothetical protein
MANPPAVNPLPKVLGSTPEPFNGKGEKAEGFWSSLENYFYLNIDHYTDENRRIASALMYFKQGTPAGDWACQRQKDALAVQPANFGTWADFASAFKKHFVPLETEMKAASWMHSFHMGQKPFNEWYQEWSNYAKKAGVDKKTRMYAFHRAIPQALHGKILEVKPQPATLDTLAETARDFDRLWWLYNTPSTKADHKCTRGYHGFIPMGICK